MAEDWTTMMSRERMAVDGRFSRELADSRFSRSEWGIVMTVVHFEIENPESPTEARLTADTSSVPAVLPELEKVRSQPMVGGPGGGSGGGGSGGGLLKTVKSFFGIGGRKDAETLEAADELVDKYCREVQSELVETGRWEAICAAASEAGDDA